MAVVAPGTRPQSRRLDLVGRRGGEELALEIGSNSGSRAAAPGGLTAGWRAPFARFGSARIRLTPTSVEANSSVLPFTGPARGQSSTGRACRRGWRSGRGCPGSSRPRTGGAGELGVVQPPGCSALAWTCFACALSAPFLSVALASAVLPAPSTADAGALAENIDRTEALRRPRYVILQFLRQVGHRGLDHGGVARLVGNLDAFLQGGAVFRSRALAEAASMKAVRPGSCPPFFETVPDVVGPDLARLGARAIDRTRRANRVSIAWRVAAIASEVAL